MPAEPVRLFVYGSLKRGELHHDEMAGACFVRETRTAARYTLLDVGPYPALVGEGDTAVEGEVYEVDAALLRRLDEFEEHPEVYRRATIELEDGARAIAYLFRASAGDPRVIAGGRWPSTPK